MTDEEKKQPEGGHRRGMFAIRLLLWTHICALLGILLMGNSIAAVEGGWK